MSLVRADAIVRQYYRDRIGRISIFENQLTPHTSLLKRGKSSQKEDKEREFR